MKYPILLASSSVTRKHLLEVIKVPIANCMSTDIDETPLPKELPKKLALRLAKEKLNAAKLKYSDHIIITADTVVTCGKKLLDKAYTKEDVKKYLKTFSGRRTTIYTGIAIWHPENKMFAKVAVAKVKFKKFTEEEINFYAESNEGIGKAGGFSISGLGGRYIIWTQGNHFVVMGLPVYEIYNVLSNWKSL